MLSLAKTNLPTVPPRKNSKTTSRAHIARSPFLQKTTEPTDQPPQPSTNDQRPTAIDLWRCCGSPNLASRCSDPPFLQRADCWAPAGRRRRRRYSQGQQPDKPLEPSHATTERLSRILSRDTPQTAPTTPPSRAAVASRAPTRKDFTVKDIAHSRLFSTSVSSGRARRAAPARRSRRAVRTAAEKKKEQRYRFSTVVRSCAAAPACVLPLSPRGRSICAHRPPASSASSPCAPPPKVCSA